MRRRFPGDAIGGENILSQGYVEDPMASGDVMLRLALFLLFATATTLAKAAELETTHLFGFTLGSDVNAVGEKEAESETVGRFGQTAGAYGVLSEALGVKFIPFQDFSIEPIVSAARFDV